MRFKLTINMDNAAFEDNGRGGELSEILHKLADRLESESFDDGGDFEGVNDSNGNRVGRWEIGEPTYRDDRDKSRTPGIMD